MRAQGDESVSFHGGVAHASNSMPEGEILRLIDEPGLIDRRTTSFVGCFVIEIGWIAVSKGSAPSFLVIEHRICWIRRNPVDSRFGYYRVTHRFLFLFPFSVTSSVVLGRLISDCIE